MLENDTLNIAHALFLRLTSAKLTIATAESCTGGLVGGYLTHFPGSSACYSGGVIAYANAAKVSLLGVDQNSLDKFGAVSSVVAEEMALGALQRCKTDIAVSCTGIAGPQGATSEKPVGLVWCGIASKFGVQSLSWQISGNRASIRDLTCRNIFVRLLAYLDEFNRSPSPKEYES